MQGAIYVDIQDVETTNAKLAASGFNNEKTITPAEMCKVLGVDGIITSNYSLSKPISEGAAIALVVVTGFWGSTNEAVATLSIHDSASEKMIWNYNDKLSSSLGSPARLVDELMRQASRRMPYFTGIHNYN